MVKPHADSDQVADENSSPPDENVGRDARAKRPPDSVIGEQSEDGDSPFSGNRDGNQENEESIAGRPAGQAGTPGDPHSH